MKDQVINRPTSPHLAIYKMQITSALSIMHRATGFFLFFGLLSVLWWVIYCVNHYDLRTYYTMNVNSGAVSSNSITNDFFINCASSGCGKIALILFSYCLFFHALAGVRHLIWDMGKGLSLKSSKSSGWFVILGSVFLTVVCWMCSLA